MNALSDRFAELFRTGRKAVLPFITGGYPDHATTVSILRGLDLPGVAAVEIGIPFSDPIADGPVIQTSFSRALERGFRVDALFAALREARPQIRVPLIAMVSYSIVYRRGVELFFDQARAAGFEALIIPDIPIEEAHTAAEIGARANCPLVLIAAPTTSTQRRDRIAALSSPFVYYQSSLGVTGERRELPSDLAGQVRRLRDGSAKPVCVGFGISTPAHVAAVCGVADGAIVGSAIVRRMNDLVERGESARIRDDVCAYVGTLVAALPAPRGCPDPSRE